MDLVLRSNHFPHHNVFLYSMWGCHGGILAPSFPPFFCSQDLSWNSKQEKSSLSVFDLKILAFIENNFLDSLFN